MTRQVLIGGKSKYLINGRNSPAGQVANLFHSVQLNVNNPHFLIMQGEFQLLICVILLLVVWLQHKY